MALPNPAAAACCSKCGQRKSMEMRPFVWLFVLVEALLYPVATVDVPEEICLLERGGPNYRNCTKGP